MTAPSPQQAKLQKLLRELFQLDQPDLDFGLYRIMHAKSREIDNFIEHDLLDTISLTLGGNQAEKIAQAKSALELEKKRTIEYGGDPDKSPKVQQTVKLRKIRKPECRLTTLLRRSRLSAVDVQRGCKIISFH